MEVETNTAAPKDGRAFSMGRLVLVLLGEGAATAFGLGGAGCGFGSRRGSHFHFVAGGRALGAQEAGSAAAGAAILSQAALQESEQLLEQASTAPGARRHTCAAFGFHGTVGMAVVVAGAAAVLAGLAAGEEAHGRESDDGEDLHWFILSEIGRAKHGLTTSLGHQFYANLGQEGAEFCSFHR